MTVAVGIGELLWDRFPGERRLGGAPANFAYHMAAFGYSAFVVSAVGNDPDGRELLDCVRRRGVDVRYVQTLDSVPTGVVDVDLDSEGIPDYLIRENAAWDSIGANHDMHSLAERTDIACCGTLAQRSRVSRTTIREFMRRMRPECIRLFDVNLRQSFYTPEVIHETLLLANAAKVSHDELGMVANILGIENSGTAALSMLRERYDLRMIALTDGERGSLLLSADEESRLPALALSMKDTVGAGDAFSAALAAGLHAALPLPEVHEFARSVAGFVCTRSGATPEYDAALRDLANRTLHREAKA